MTISSLFRRVPVSSVCFVSMIFLNFASSVLVIFCVLPLVLICYSDPLAISLTFVINRFIADFLEAPPAFLE